MRVYQPMEAQPAKTPFSSKDWIFEIKWDGIRAITYTKPELSIKSADQEELKLKFPELWEIADSGLHMVLDGEIVILSKGKVDLETLYKRMNASAEEAEKLAVSFPSTYVVFDVLEMDDRSLIEEPLTARKAILKTVVHSMKHVVLSIFADEKGEAYFRAALKQGFESIIAKEKNSRYEPGVKSDSWLEIKQARILKEYIQKRDFTRTKEPIGLDMESRENVFVVQEHHSRRLHYDFRLARDGVLKSWAVPKGVPEKSGIRRLAIQTEDHPMAYADFQGTIPKGQYGAGTVKIWDKGEYEPKTWSENKVEVFLKGKKLQGIYALVKLKKESVRPHQQTEWLLMKMRIR